ncbi:MAG TPA: MmcQ/YjbR family DNA-binding protein [Bryobacteraceae bacterium]|nr:MmcQ/YjbR family DNA-binding protein [Bryobacteraceae bacterium]
MQIEWVRRYCMQLPHATETVQWGNHLVFKIGGKIFAILALEPSPVWLSYKCSPETFAELVEREGIIPAPYLARNHWVGLESEDALAPAELKRLLKCSYDMVFEKLPNKTRATFG